MRLTFKVTPAAPSAKPINVSPRRPKTTEPFDAATEQEIKHEEEIHQDAVSLPGFTRKTNSTHLFETQQIAPPPGNTYYQLILTKEQVILNDWPRQRFSQKWTRNGQLNPGQVKMSHQEFVNGEIKEQFCIVFGNELYEHAVEISRKVITGI